MQYDTNVHLSARLPTKMVVEAAQKTQYHRYRALSYGVPAELLSAKSELPMKPDGREKAAVAVTWGMDGQKHQRCRTG